MSNSTKSTISVNFRPARVCKGKELYVEYYCRSPFDDVMNRYRIRLNYLKLSLTDKIKYAEKVALNINNKLQEGWNPALDLESKNQYMSLSKAFKDFMSNRKNELRPDTMRMYISIWKVFTEYIEINYKSELFVVQIDKNVSSKFMRYITTERKVSQTTYNNYLNGFNVIFNWYVAQGYHTFNPYSHIKRKKTPIKRRMYINHEYKEKIKKYLQENDFNFYVLTMCSYMTLLRRKELTMLKIKDVLFDKSLLFVSGEISKNGKDYHVTIPKSLLNLLQSLHLDQYPDHYYVFSNRGLKPGPYRVPCKFISDKWDRMRNALDIDSRIQFMSLRDTGIRELVQKRVPLDDVMKHARHWSLEVTKTYLIHDEIEANKNILNALEL